MYLRSTSSSTPPINTPMATPMDTLIVRPGMETVILLIAVDNTLISITPRVRGGNTRHCVVMWCYNGCNIPIGTSIVPTITR